MCALTFFCPAISRILATVLSALCQTTLTADRLDRLPDALRQRPELAALRHAVALADGAATLRAHVDMRAAAEGVGRSRYLAALAFNLARLQRLDALLAAARAAGLRLVVFKGGLLARTHYGDPGARPMVDIDLLCAPGDVARAVELGQDLGMTRYDPEPFRLARAATHDVKLADRGVTVELHHRLWHELRVGSDVEPILARATEVPFGDGTTLAPDEADHLYVVCVHAAMHAFAGNALWMTDAALLVAGAPRPLWARAAALATAARGRVALAAARDQLRQSMPWLPLDGDGDGAGAREAAPLRRAIVRRLSPWLQRGEGELGPWPSRLVRPLLFDRARDLGGWAFEKLQMWRGARSS